MSGSTDLPVDVAPDDLRNGWAAVPLAAQAVDSHLDDSRSASAALANEAQVVASAVDGPDDFATAAP